MSKTWRRIVIVAASALLLLGAAGGGYMWHLYRKVEQTTARMYAPLPRTLPAYVSSDPLVARRMAVPDAGKREETAERPLTVLILGVDERADEHGRTDTLMVASLDPERESALLFNIPRDTRTVIAGLEREDKINHAYAYGGEEMAVRTAERFLDYPIDYYVKVNMNGFARVIDRLGGVEVANKTAFSFGGYTFDNGRLKLDGKAALAYTRMRKEDPRGDLGRNERQRQVLVQMVRKAAGISGVKQFDGLLTEASEHVRTNMSLKEMKTIAFRYRTKLRDVQMTEVEGKGQTIGGVWYYIVEPAERQRLHDLLVRHT